MEEKIMFFSEGHEIEAMIDKKNTIFVDKHKEGI